MHRRLIRKLNLHFSALWGLYWVGWAAIWGYLSPFLLHRGFSNSRIGVISFCALLLPIAVQPVLSSLSDRTAAFTSRRLAMALTGAALIAGIGVWLIDDSLICSLLLVVVGAALTCIAPYFNAMSMEFTLRGVEVNFSASRGFGSATYAVTSLALGSALKHFAPALLLPVYLLSFAALFFCLLLFRYPLPELQASPNRQTPVPLSNAALLRRYPAFTLLLLGCALLMSSHSSLNAYMIHVVERAGGDQQVMGTVFFLSGLIEIPGMLLFTRLHRKLSLRVLTILCAAFFVLRALGFYLAASPLALCLVCTLQLFGHGAFIPATVYYIAEEIDPANQVKGQALIYTTSSGIGAAAGSLICGRLLDSAGVNAMMLYCVAAPAAATLVVILAFSLKKRKDGDVR